MSDRLTALLDTILPGGEGFPPASGVGVDLWLKTQERFWPGVEDLLSRLPADFAAAGPVARTKSIEALEANEPALFDAVTVAIYSGYYTRPDVLTVIEAARGYKATPPQPGGYDLPAFDLALLSVPASRPPLWRDPEEELTV